MSSIHNSLLSSFFNYDQSYQGFLYFRYYGLPKSNGKYAAPLRILLQTFHQGRLRATEDFILYYGFQHYGFLHISMDFDNFVLQYERSIIDYLTGSAYFILFKMGQSTKFLVEFSY